MEPNNFEKDFREKLNQRKIEPSDKAWDRLDAMLSVAEEEKHTVGIRSVQKRKWLYIAASIVGFLLVGTFFFNQKEKGIEIPKNKVVFEEKKEGNTLDKPGTIKEDIGNSQIQKKIMKPLSIIEDNKIQKEQSKQLENKEEKTSIINNPKEENAVVVNTEKKDQPTARNKYISAEELLAEVSNTKFETKATVETIAKQRKAVSVNPDDLLLNAETELNQSFRESALDKFNKNFKAVKTAVVNRNYKE
ncbi:hypothetical protein EV144_106146 [Flavobacterium sp. 270]|uniref:hypothetical protein n=1 Tax=Flavobacterium sp. 270 TaxID=2512114 RepID=UPI001064BDE2|nr:hypothetical protein [Flavobacterium sp. 270]TDW46475.1 hypothetical protein EV144_106146 [Flavobacterium sp. 270]